MSDFDLPSGSPGCAGLTILVLIVTVIAIAAGVATLGMVDNINQHQATVAQQATMQEQLRAEVRTVQAEQATVQERIREDARTERWQSFLVAMTVAKTDITLLSAAGIALVFLIFLAIVDRRCR